MAKIPKITGFTHPVALGGGGGRGKASPTPLYLHPGERPIFDPEAIAFHRKVDPPKTPILAIFGHFWPFLAFLAILAILAIFGHF